MNTFPFLSLILFTTLFGGLIIMLLPPHRHLLIKLVAGISSFIAFGLSLTVYLLYDKGVAGFQFVERYDWLPRIGISYQIGVDGIGLSMILLTGIIIFTGVLISSHEFLPGGLLGKVGRPKEFFSLLLVLVTGVFGVFISLDLFFLFLFYELAVLPMYLLIGIWGTGKKEYCAMKLTIYLLFGSALILVGLLALYFGSGLNTFDWFILKDCNFSFGFQKAFFPIIFVGFGILAGLWPLHTWSPDGHASAPSSVSMLHAGVLMKLGAFGIIRVAITLLPEGAREWCPIIVFLPIVNIVYGALVAMSQKDLKYVVAYSSVSHMGIVLLGICSLNTLSLNGAVFQMFSHGVMTGLFFALVGCVYGRTHTRTLKEMGGLAKLTPFLAVAFAIAGLTSLGLPGLSGFVAEVLVFLGAFRSYPILTIIAGTGIVITAIYVLRVLQKIFFSTLNPKFVAADGHHNATIPIRDATLIEKIALSILMLVLILFGLWPSFIVEVIKLGIPGVLGG